MYQTQQSEMSALLKIGVIAGVIAGIGFALAEMFINLLILGAPFLGPLRLISSIVLGPQALQPTYPLASSLIVGMIVHLILSSIYGLVFVNLLKWSGQLGASAILKLIYGAFFGLALWVVNFLIISPIVFPQFGNANPFWNGFFAHTFFYGGIIGLYSASVIAGQKAGRDMNREMPNEMG
jgi:uncharacterized membrane protein YagU involved in acid resistance